MLEHISTKETTFNSSSKKNVAIRLSGTREQKFRSAILNLMALTEKPVGLKVGGINTAEHQLASILE